MSVLVAHFSAPRGETVVRAEDLDVDLDDTPVPTPPRTTPGEWFEHSRVLGC